jgi:phosphatidylserine decarboxylase
MKSRQFSATYRHSAIAREGWTILAVTALAAALFQILVDPVIGVLFWIPWFLLLYLFRDPRRDVPSIPLAVLSPVDGQVVAISEEREEQTGRNMRRVRLLMNPFGVYSIRSPLEAKIIRQWFPGRRNEGAFGQWLQSDEGDDVILLIGTGRLRRIPSCYAQAGDRVGQGQRCGFVPFGAHLDLLIPENSRLRVREGDRVASGVSVVATLLRG